MPNNKYDLFYIQVPSMYPNQFQKCLYSISLYFKHYIQQAEEQQRKRGRSEKEVRGATNGFDDSVDDLLALCSIQ